MNTENVNTEQGVNQKLADQIKKRDSLILEMFDKYTRYKTLQKVAEDYGYTRERVRQYFSIGNKKGLISYKPFNRENFKKIRQTVTSEKLQEYFSQYGTVKNISEKAGISLSHINRLIRIYGIKIRNLRKEHLKVKILNEYNDMVARNGDKKMSTYDLLLVEKGRNLWARIARTWGSFTAFRRENNIVLPSKARRRKKNLSSLNPSVQF